MFTSAQSLMTKQIKDVKKKKHKEREMRMHRRFARGLAAGSCKIVKRNVKIVRHDLHQF